MVTIYANGAGLTTQPIAPLGVPALTPIIVIPARMASSRLPGKPLAMINGRPMIAHVWGRAREADLGPVVVACADAEIADIIRDLGGNAVMTDPSLPSGSDRVSAALEAFDPGQQFSVVVNLQGDLPTLPSQYLSRVLEVLDTQEFEIATLAAAITTDVEAASASVVKVATAFLANQSIAPALYFSRASIPWGDGPRFHHIGLYAYKRASLQRFVALPPSPLEMRESLEQLRALEAGMRIGCALVAEAPLGIDTPADLERVRRQGVGAAC